MIKDQQNFGAGILFILIGALGVVVGLGYKTGSASQMGPGYFPVLLSAGIFVIGLIVGLRALRLPGPKIARPSLRPLLAILSAIILFGLMIKPFGLAPTTIACILVAAAASPQTRWKEALIIALIMACTVSALFIYLLNQQMTVFGS